MLIICMDGLGGHPELTFGELKHAFDILHHVVFADIEGIVTHEDRVQSVIRSFKAGQKMLDKMNESDRRIILIGQSAGGSAVRVAAARLRDDKSLSGIVTMSQAPSRHILYTTPELTKAMVGRSKDLLLGHNIDLTREEYSSFVMPMNGNLQKFVDGRQTVPGREARTLASFFWAPKLERYDRPTLVIYPEKDQWIAPSAHRTMVRKMREHCTSQLESFEVEGSGHITLASDRSQEVINKIKGWIETLP